MNGISGNESFKDFSYYYYTNFTLSCMQFSPEGGFQMHSSIYGKGPLIFVRGENFSTKMEFDT